MVRCNGLLALSLNRPPTPPPKSLKLIYATHVDIFLWWRGGLDWTCVYMFRIMFTL